MSLARRIGARDWRGDPALVTHLEFAGISAPVALVDCEELVPVIRAVLRGWPVRETDFPSSDDAVITIRKTIDGYRRESRWLSRPTTYRDPVNAVCDFLVDLVKAFVADRPSMLCLHTAAVELGGGLVIFPNAYKAGKWGKGQHHMKPDLENASFVIFFGTGVMLIAMGSGLYLAADLGPGPRDGIMTGLHQRFGWSIRTIRFTLEVAVLALGWLLGGTVGVGTVAFALLVGPLVQGSLRVVDRDGRVMRRRVRP